MRKINIILGIVVALISFSSCVSDEKDLFDKSAAQRLNDAVSTYKTALQDSPNGWEMDFYPSDKSMGGYIYTAKFNNGTATMACELSFSNSSTKQSWPAGTEVSSKYQVISEQSAVLTFDTYNLLFHFWSEPKGSSDTDGYASDYEFIFQKMSADNDTITLKGKKYGNLLVMTKLSEPSSSYITATLSTSKLLESIPRMKMTIGGTTYPISMADRILNYYTTTDGSGEAQAVPFVYIPGGVKLYEPITVNGVTFQTLYYNESTGELATKDGKVVMLFPSAMDRFCAGTTQWHFIFDGDAKTGDMSDEFLTIFNQAYADDKASSETIKDFYIGGNLVGASQDSNRQCIGWISDWLGFFDFNVSYGCTIKQTDANKVAITPTSPGFNYDYYSIFDPLVQYIGKNSPYIATFDSEKTPTKVKLVSAANDKAWFTLSVNK